MSDKDIDIKAAALLAADTLRHQAQQEWWAEREFMIKARGGELTLSDVHEKLGSQTGRAFSKAMQMLVDIAMHAPTARDRTRAAEVICKVHLAEVELKCKYLEGYRVVAEGGQVVSVPQAEVRDLPALPAMTPEEMTELIQARRKGLKP